MKLLVITNAYPSKEKKYSGIFVKNQVEWFQEHTDINIDLFFIKRSFTTVFGSVRKYISSYFRFLPLLKKQYDVLHVHFLSPLLILSYVYKLFHPSAKVYITMHGSDINNLNNKTLIAVYRQLITKVDVIICVGRSMNQSVRLKLKREADHFLCAGINTSAIYPLNKSYTERDIDLLYVGSFYDVKGVDLLIEALSKLKNEGLKVVFIGSGNYKKELEQLSDAIDLTVMHSLEQKEINMFYNQSKFFVFPSRSEGFGLSLAEAMYCGTPGIISNLEQLKYQVSDGWNGYVCEDLTPPGFAKVIRQATSASPEKWTSLSRNAREETEQYTIDNVCRALQRIYTANGVRKEH